MLRGNASAALANSRVFDPRWRQMRKYRWRPRRDCTLAAATAELAPADWGKPRGAVSSSSSPSSFWILIPRAVPSHPPSCAPALTIVLRADYTRGNVCKWWTWVRRNHPGTLSACAGSTENFTATPKRRRKELDIRAGAGEGGESGARGGQAREGRRLVRIFVSATF